MNENTLIMEKEPSKKEIAIFVFLRCFSLISFYLLLPFCLLSFSFYSETICQVAMILIGIASGFMTCRTAFHKVSFSLPLLIT